MSGHCLAQFRRVAEKARVFRKRVAVGHAGDEVARAARARGFIGAAGIVAPFFRQIGGMRGVTRL